MKKIPDTVLLTNVTLKLTGEDAARIINLTEARFETYAKRVARETLDEMKRGLPQVDVNHLVMGGLTPRLTVALRNVLNFHDIRPSDRRRLFELVQRCQIKHQKQYPYAWGRLRVPVTTAEQLRATEDEEELFYGKTSIYPYMKKARAEGEPEE